RYISYAWLRHIVAIVPFQITSFQECLTEEASCLVSTTGLPRLISLNVATATNSDRSSTNLNTGERLLFIVWIHPLNMLLGGRSENFDDLD
uniref:Uncharacterized protein n=1 Tax=Parascaris univalens TaxID=6257 RepID=A0A914ZHR5_PARUN